MYDISAWSYSYLWGSTVDKVGLVTDPAIGATTPVTSLPSNASAPAESAYTTFELAGVQDYVALNGLLEEGAGVSMLADGSAIVEPESFDLVVDAADEYGVEFDEATEAEIAELALPETQGLSDLTVGYVGSQDDSLSLAQLGFDDLTALTATTIQNNPAVLDGIDILWVGSTLSTTNATVLSALQGYVASGRSIVGRGTAAFNVEKTLGLIESTATAVNGWGSGNGIVAVDTPAGSMLEPYAQGHSFIYPAYTFTGLTGATTVEQTYAAHGDTGKTLAAGHWRSTTATNGPDYFVGKPSVISGEAASGSTGVVFGTSVVYRTHTKGGFSQAARALFTSSGDSAGATAQVGTTVAVGTPATVTYPGVVELPVTVSATGETPTGVVEVFDATSTSVGMAVLADGAATVSVEGVLPGSSTFTVAYLPDNAHFASSSSEPVTATVDKASSTLKLGAKVVKKAKGAKKAVASVTVTLSVPGLTPGGTVKITDKGTVLRTVTVDASGKATITVKVAKGNHRLRAWFAGSDLVTASSSTPVVLKIK